MRHWQKVFKVASRFLMFWVFLILPVFSFITPNIVIGGVTNPTCPANTLCNPLKSEFDTIPKLFQAILGIAAEIGSVFVILGIIYSGFLFVMARGNQEELSKAKRAITYSVIGAALVLGAWAFSVAIANTINTITKP